jgi:ABC-type glycerol-3-phosphate transport system substrate-binding protein
MKRILFILLLGALLTACSGLGFIPTKEPVTIRFASMGNNEVYQALAEKYRQENPSITIEFIKPPVLGANFDTILEQFSKADIIRMNSVFLSQDRLPSLRPIDAFISIDKSFNRDDFFPGSLDGLQIDQVQYGLPAGLSPLVMYYDALRFKIAKASPPGLDYSLDDFIVYASQVNNPNTEDADEGLFSYGFCTHPQKEDILVLTYLFGGGLFDRIPDPTQVTFDRPENVTALRWYASLYLDYDLAPPVGENEYEIFRLINNNQCGMWMSWLNQLNYLDDNANEQHAIPMPRGNAKIGFAYLDGYFLTNTSEHPAEAYDFMSFLVNQVEAANGSIPPLLSQVNSATFSQAHPDMTVIAQRMPREVFFMGFNNPQNERLLKAIGLFYEAVDQVVRGSVDPGEALQEAQQKAEELFR